MSEPSASGHQPAAPPKSGAGTPTAAPAPAAAGASKPAAPAAAPPAPPARPPEGFLRELADSTPGSSYAVPEDGIGVLTVPPEDLFTAARRVKEAGYPLLSLLSAYDRGDHFGVLYAFVRLAGSPVEWGEVRLRVVIPKKAGEKVLEPSCPSLVDLFAAADWQEREMWDMYGIRFQGHPDLRRIFLPEGWTGHPQRKDYKEPEQFVAMADGEDVVVRTPQEGAW